MKILILFLRTIVVSMYKTQSPFQRLLLLKTKEIKFSATGKRQMLQVYVTEPINYFLNLITHLIFNSPKNKAWAVFCLSLIMFLIVL